MLKITVNNLSLNGEECESRGQLRHLVNHMLDTYYTTLDEVVAQNMAAALSKEEVKALFWGSHTVEAQEEECKNAQ